jgi:hypothetical protein
MLCSLTSVHAVLMYVTQAERQAVVEGRTRLLQQLMSKKLVQIR